MEQFFKTKGKKTHVRCTEDRALCGHFITGAEVVEAKEPTCGNCRKFPYPMWRDGLAASASSERPE